MPGSFIDSGEFSGGEKCPCFHRMGVVERWSEEGNKLMNKRVPWRQWDKVM